MEIIDDHHQGEKYIKMFKTVSKKFVNYNLVLFVLFILFIFSVSIGGAKEISNAVSISPDDFTALIEKMSEPDGTYDYENWTTNESDYLDIMDKIKKYNINGGAYIGVGPDQNFTFIEAIEPEIAFIVDIRKQNTILHLIYKVLFELSETRINFFSRLFSKPVLITVKPSGEQSIDELVMLFRNTPSSPSILNKTKKEIITVLKNKYHFKLDEKDVLYINKIMRFFYEANLDIRYDTNDKNINDPIPAKKRFMTFSEVLTKIDQKGEQKNVFASENKYLRLRKMQIENRIIPLTGDFSGTYTFVELSKFLKENKILVGSFYSSSVEWYLIQNQEAFNSWADNVKLLPINNDSVFLRHSVYYKNQVISFSTLSHEFRLQRINVFLKNFSNREPVNINSIWHTDYLK